MAVERYYADYWSEGGFQPHGRLTRPVASLLERYVKRDARTLDIGCGDGRSAGLWLADHARSYIGVDISAPAVASACDLGLDARRVEDATALPFGDGRFDAVVCFEVLEHVFDPRAVVQEASRVMTAGGVLIVTVPNVAYWRRRADMAVLGRWNPLGDDLSTEQPWRDPHIRFFTARSLSHMLAHTSLEVVELGGHGGTLLGDIPGLRRLCRRHGGWTTPGWAANPVYSIFERAAPSLLGYRLYAVARTRRL